MANANNRKFGRNKTRGQSKIYTLEQRYAKNKEARRLRTLKKQPTNKQVQKPCSHS